MRCENTVEAQAICHAEMHRLRAENRRLRTAAQAVVDRWHTPNWKDATHTAVFIHALEAALREGDTSNA